jgi:hypothetical protein
LSEQRLRPAVSRSNGVRRGGFALPNAPIWGILGPELGLIRHPGLLILPLESGGKESGGLIAFRRRL